MRNLKRALSLTLASVMLLGMMVVGSSAAGYPDVSEEENVEAIEVLQTVGVMEGDNNGNFNPDDYVTREQMAVIMSKLLNLDYNYYQGTNPFSDVPAWAAPYVAACAANGITSGIGGGMYGAGQNVNAVQAALMMLKALGYFQYQQDFGEDYVLATVKQATEIGLFSQIDSKAEQALTRNEVAQMALNALQSDLVRFTGDPGVKYTGSNGESWIGGYKAEYTPRTSTDPKYNRLIDNKHSSDIDHSGQYYCQLGEELYNGNLVKRIDSDIFERPSYTWTYKTEKIGTYIDREKLQERLAKLAGGVAVIRVGAATETEMKEAKLRMEDALAATRAAVEEGIICGGGSAYIHASKEVAKLADELEGDEKTGAKVILKALESPLYYIAANAGLEGAVIINKVKESAQGTGFNVSTEEYVDMVANGILDPVKVTRSALQNATSVASTLLTTESVVANIKEETPAMPAGNPGMGMM